ncbi:unnamed protein product [Urochloa humidicola]
MEGHFQQQSTSSGGVLDDYLDDRLQFFLPAMHYFFDHDPRVHFPSKSQIGAAGFTSQYHQMFVFTCIFLRVNQACRFGFLLIPVDLLVRSFTKLPSWRSAAAFVWGSCRLFLLRLIIGGTTNCLVSKSVVNKKLFY